MFLLQIESLSVTFHGHDLIVDSELELNYGRFVILARLAYIGCCNLYLEFLLMVVNVLNFFQTLWFTWIKWLWKIYFAYGNRFPGTSDSGPHGYLSPYQGN